MDYLKKQIGKYTGFLRSFKPIYTLNNFLHQRKLQYNKQQFEKHGIKRSVFNSIGKQDFKGSGAGKPWLDGPGALERMTSHPDYKSFYPTVQQAMKDFVTQGMMTLSGFYTNEEVDKHWNEIEQLKKEGKIALNYTGKKYMKAYEHSAYIRDHFFKHSELKRILSFLMGKKILPFHTIHFEQGSEQRAHSDSIHMTTEPEGYLIAAWTALESTDKANGPLFYFPGSHTLPYITCQDYDSGNSRWLIGEQSYKRYEDKIEELIKEYDFKPVYFHGNPGDVFIWHANLLHGGAPIDDPSRTRKSMVAHYFCEDVICYHEISQRLALIDTALLMD
jgi:hypothetical protein